MDSAATTRQNRIAHGKDIRIRDLEFRVHTVEKGAAEAEKFVKKQQDFKIRLDCFNQEDDAMQHLWNTIKDVEKVLEHLKNE